MQLEVASTAAGAAEVAARLVATVLGIAIGRRTRASVALSGGNTPLPMLRALAREPLDWSAIHVYQVDERVVARGDSARNLGSLDEVLVWRGPLPRRNLHPMWVDRANLYGAAESYGRELAQVAGDPPVLDVVHLGLGADGHTASLFSGDPALGIEDRSVALTNEHNGYRRMTLTLPVLNRARSVIWFVTGADKAGMVGELYAGGAAFPAGRVSRRRAILVVDQAAGREASKPKRRRPQPRSVVVPIRSPDK
ncbi:MAG: 6-phosphogluconolactonase [Gammaproteobacteria bacterium]|nr:6-phosphogluconolactonase [Gammaproteobacteria bacterium]